MYEHRKQPLAPIGTFYQRVLKNILIAIFILSICLVIGVAGYYYTTAMPLIDALHNAAMILGGMGLVDTGKVSSDTAKLFSSFYALFSGVVFITNIGIILAPALHRLFHRLHVEDK
jgi:Co/Zn/Cd efflux system component